MNFYLIAEDENLQDSRAQREAIDKEMRRILMLLDAGIPAADVEYIATGRTEITEPELEAA